MTPFPRRATTLRSHLATLSTLKLITMDAMATYCLVLLCPVNYLRQTL